MYGTALMSWCTWQVSARRWHRLGFLRTCLVNQAILAAWACGVGPNTLADWYYGPPTAASDGTAGDTADGTISSGGFGAIAPAGDAARGKPSRPPKR